MTDAGLAHHHRQINGLRLHFVEQGSGPPVLLLHGFPESCGAWHAVMARLGAQFRAIALDTRGIAGSEAPAGVEGYAMDELVEDVRQLIVALDLERLTLVGHDWGGFIAWEVAIRLPRLLDRLVIINAAHTGIFEQLLRSDAAQAKASRYMLAFRSARGEELVSRNDFAAFRSEILEPAIAAGTLSESQAAQYLAAWRKPGGITAGLNYYRANKSGPPSGDDAAPRRLQETVVQVPTLVIWGERDVYFTLDNIDLLPQVVPNLRVRRFADQGHWIVHHRPAEVADLIARFASDGLPDGA